MPPSEPTSAAESSNSVGDEWVMVEKADCPTAESIDNLSHQTTTNKRLLEPSELINDITRDPVVVDSGDAPPLQKKLRTEEAVTTSDQDTIEAIKKQQGQVLEEAVKTSTAVDNGSSLVA